MSNPSRSSPSANSAINFGSPAPSLAAEPRPTGLGISSTPAQPSPLNPAHSSQPTTAAAGDVNTELSAEQQEEYREYFGQLRLKWIELNAYLEVGRGERVNYISQMQGRMALYSNLVHTMSPAQYAMFASVFTETENILRQMEFELGALDLMIEPEKTWLRDELNRLAQHIPRNFQTYQQEFDWPTPTVATQLNVSSLVWRA